MVTTPEYYQRNKEKILADSRARYFANKEKYLEYQRSYRQQNKDLINKKTRDKRLKRITKATELLGGRCSKCLQKYDPVCYDFHHVDPNQKDFTIGENMLLAEKKLFDEIKKCILLCANCHRLTHKEQLQNDH